MTPSIYFFVYKSLSKSLMGSEVKYMVVALFSQIKILFFPNTKYFVKLHKFS